MTALYPNVSFNALTSVQTLQVSCFKTSYQSMVPSSVICCVNSLAARLTLAFHYL